ncbi:ATP-dependent DNA ligase [Occallatibacter riparius]|uniref:DNA ligase (ATP) n=1 Tax=Occallatibacter riparius TaxID=1002689 RepID=A0A9J7BJ72_9BACT|nr:ATP-dependent DNA ligase [Occallatibacter riparius]UWZ81842.1 ATP-dependent DNA ligase [Occallatibacter riparius]
MEMHGRANVMNLPVHPPVLPMLAKRVDTLPTGPDWIYEPKWDGFRTLVFRDGDEVLLQSRDEKSLNRYFPELIAPLLQQLPKRCVLDGEIVISTDGALDFDALQLRIHPAASRVKTLSQRTPASVVFFDLLAEGTHDWRQKGFSQRRERLQAILAKAKPPLHVTPATDALQQAQDWFQRFEGAGFDGVVAKAKESPYDSDKRTMIKVKHERDCDCVVAGFRWYRKSSRPAIGSLLLGLYDESRVLQHVGVCGSFPMETRYELVDYLKPYRKGANEHHPWNNEMETDGSTHRRPGGQSRWSQGKDLSWEPLRLELVAEVAYEHMQSGRFRHMAQFRRWRFDKKPEDCTYEQLEVVPPKELSEIFLGSR